MTHAYEANQHSSKFQEYSLGFGTVSQIILLKYFAHSNMKLSMFFCMP